MHNLLDIHTPMGNELCSSSKGGCIRIFKLRPLLLTNILALADTCMLWLMSCACSCNACSSKCCLPSFVRPTSFPVHCFLKCFLVWHFSCILQHGSVGVLWEYLHSQKGRFTLLRLDLFLNYNANSPPCRLKWAALMLFWPWALSGALNVLPLALMRGYRYSMLYLSDYFHGKCDIEIQPGDKTWVFWIRVRCSYQLSCWGSGTWAEDRRTVDISLFSTCTQKPTEHHQTLPRV